jgi:hypothetical protein
MTANASMTMGERIGSGLTSIFSIGRGRDKHTRQLRRATQGRVPTRPTVGPDLSVADGGRQVTGVPPPSQHVPAIVVRTCDPVQLSAGRRAAVDLLGSNSRPTPARRSVRQQGERRSRPPRDALPRSHRRVCSSRRSHRASRFCLDLADRSRPVPGAVAQPAEPEALNRS